MEAWSMSGFVMTRLALRRIRGRSAWGVSPSYTAARTCGSLRSRTCLSWSRARALVGNRYRAVRFSSARAVLANTRL